MVFSGGLMRFLVAKRALTHSYTLTLTIRTIFANLTISNAILNRHLSIILWHFMSRSSILPTVDPIKWIFEAPIDFRVHRTHFQFRVFNKTFAVLSCRQFTHTRTCTHFCCCCCCCRCLVCLSVFYFIRSVVYRDVCTLAHRRILLMKKCFVVWAYVAALTRAAFFFANKSYFRSCVRRADRVLVAIGVRNNHWSRALKKNKILWK